MAGNVFRIAGIQPSADSKQLFEQLAQEADDGDLVGAVVVSMYRRSRGRGRPALKQYYLTMSGWASNNPTFAAGAMGACQVLVHELALQEAGLAP